MSELFRKKALAKYLRVDAPGAILTIAPPWTLVVFAVMGVLFVALALFAAFGQAQVAAEGRGVVRPDAPLIVLRAPLSGTVLSIAHAPRESGHAGESLLVLDTRAQAAAFARCNAELATARADLAALDKRLADWNDRDASMALVLLAQVRTQREKTSADEHQCEVLDLTVKQSQITFPVDAVIVGLDVSAGGQVHEGDVLATLLPSSAHLVGYLALGEQYRSELEPGQSVRMKFDALPSDAVGVGSARVVRVLDTLPSGVKIENAATTAATPSVFAELSLDPLPGARPARTGMTFSGDVLTRRESLLAVVFGDD